MTLGRLRRSRRGVVIEMAIFMLVVVFGLCSIILTFSLSIQNQRRIQSSAFHTTVAVEQLGEWFIAGAHKHPLPDGYSIDEESDSETAFTIKVPGGRKFAVEISEPETDVKAFTVRNVYDDSEVKPLLFVRLRLQYDPEGSPAVPEILCWKCSV